MSSLLRCKAAARTGQVQTPIMRESWIAQFTLFRNPSIGDMLSWLLIPLALPGGAKRLDLPLPSVMLTSAYVGRTTNYETCFQLLLEMIFSPRESRLRSFRNTSRWLAYLEGTRLWPCSSDPQTGGTRQGN